MNYIKLLSALILLSLQFNHGISQKDIRKADKQLELRAYDLAIKNYKAYLDENPDNKYAQQQLAEAYRRTNELMKAVYWYEKSVDLGTAQTSEIINYGNSLKKLGLYERARKVFGSLGAKEESLSVVHLKGCEAAIELLKAEDEYELHPFDGNSINSDFGSVMYQDQIVFSSFRTDLKRNESKKNLSYIKAFANDLFIAPHKEIVEESELKFLNSDFSITKGVGPVSFSEDLKLIAYTKNNLSDGAISAEGQDADLSLYLADVNQDGSFANERALPFNEIESSYAFPHLAFNGSALYFSSNREGGFGGFDLYVTYIKNGEWTTPENLGETINSAANEITPFLRNNQLYFSSDQVNGLGGFDVYHSEVQEGEWSSPQNMGKGVNSPGDDYYLISYGLGEYMFTSNRLGGRGKDDIYFASENITLADEILAQEVPDILDLDELAENKIETPNEDIISADNVADVSESDEVNTTKVSATEESLFNEEGEFKLYDHYDLDLAGAIKTGEEKSPRYFIQIASLKKSKGQIEDFNNLKSLGNLYRFVTAQSTKIRLGSFDSRTDADRILTKVRSQGYRDAFVTTAALSQDNTDIELLNGDTFVNYYSDEENEVGPLYKVRLASYSDATWFNPEELNYLDGELEQWTKGYWHIFILSGFNSLEEAESARIKAVNRGFKEAEVVIDDRGVLKKLSQY